MSRRGSDPRVLFFGLGDITKPSTRYRCYDMARYMGEQGLDARVFSLRTSLDAREGALLKEPRTYVEYLRVCRRSDVVVFQKHYSRNSLRAMRATKAMGKRVVYDIDDSIHTIRAYSDDVIAMARMADQVVASSHFLEDEFRAHNPNTVRLITPVDTEFYKPLGLEREGGRVVVGWLGTPDNFRHLAGIAPALRDLEGGHDVEFHFITDVPSVRADAADLGLRGVQLVPWDLADVNERLNRFDVGVSPLGYVGDETFKLFADESQVYSSHHWVMGKSAQKDREYMSAGLPVVSSALGEIVHVIKDGENGFLARDGAEWGERLERLVASPDLRARMGTSARRTCEEGFSLDIQGDTYIEVLRDLWSSG